MIIHPAEIASKGLSFYCAIRSSQLRKLGLLLDSATVTVFADGNDDILARIKISTEFLQPGSERELALSTRESLLHRSSPLVRSVSTNPRARRSTAELTYIIDSGHLLELDLA